MSEQLQTTWSSKDRNLLESALALLPTEGIAYTPITTLTWNQEVFYASQISTTLESLPSPPEGVNVETIPVAGVFMQVKLPTALEWLDRAMTRERQAEIYFSAQSSPALAFFLFRLSTAGSVDPQKQETIEGVTAMLNAGLITHQEAALLRA